MAKQYKILVNTGKQENNKTVDVQQFSGDKGQPVRIKAQAGAKYQLQEATRGKNVAPDYVKAKRVGKHLHILFEDETQASLIIEDYYGEMAPGYNGVIGEAENGHFYEYIPEDPRVPGLIPELAEGGQAVNVALGGAEIAPVGAVVAAAAFPLMGALGLLGAAGAAAIVANQNNGTTTSGTTTGRLDPTAPNDSGALGDNKTNDNTPTLSGTVPTGATATVTINGQTYPVTVAADGSWKFTNPTNLPDGTYYPILHVTQNGVTKDTNLTPFTIDTTPPTIAITSSAALLAPNETATVTFTLSEAVSDFSQDDVVVAGGTLSNFQRDPSNPLKYTATFTPSSTGTSATISVASGKFSDAAANLNTDGAEANNTVTLATNATVTGALDPNATNANGTPNDSGAKNDNLTNDNTPTLKGKVPAGSSAKILINGVEQPVQVDANGNWIYTVPSGLADGTYTPKLVVTPPGSSTPNPAVPLTPFTIDTVPPSIAITAPTNSLIAGQTTPITFTLSEPVSDFSADDIQVTGGTLSNLQQSATDPKVWTATFTPASTGTSATISVASSKFSDAAANFNTDGAEANNTVTLATNAAASGGLSPASDNTTGTPNDSKTNDATPELAGKVAPGSTVKVKIKNAQGTVVGEGTATVDANGNWTYTQPDNLPDGTYSPELTVNGGSPVPLKPFVIDTVPPTVAVTAPVSTLAAGASTTVTFTLSEAATDLTDADFQVTGGTLGALQQSASNPLVYTATFTSATGGAASVSVASNKFSDAAGNLNTDGADTNNTWAFNTAVNPGTAGNASKTALTIDPITGDNILLAAEQGANTIAVTGKVTGKFAAGDVVQLTLNGHIYTATVAADGSYTVNVSMADIKADADTKIDGTITGTGGDTATAAQDYTLEAGNTLTQTALSINTVTADNILSAAENTGSIAITGKVTGKFATGDVVTLTLNGKTFTGTAAADGSYSINVPAADLAADSDTLIDGTVTGTGGTQAKAIQDYGVHSSTQPDPYNPPNTGTKTAIALDAITGDNVLGSTETGSINVTGKVSGTFVAGDTVTLYVAGKTYTGTAAANGTFSIAVPAADLLADQDTKIEADVNGTGGDKATAAQDYIVEANPAAPTKTALSIDPITGDNLITAAEKTGNITVTGKVSGKFSINDTVTLTVNGKTYTGTVLDAAGNYSVSVLAADLTADADSTIDASVTGTGGSAATALQNYAIESAADKTALTIDPVTGDNVITATESGATLTTITGKVSGKFAAGDTVTLTLNSKPYTANVAADGSYQVKVTTTDLTADSDKKIEGTVTGTGGTVATAAQTYTVESSDVVTKTALIIDPVTPDNVLSSNETGTIAITGKVTGKFAAGDTVTLTVNGKTFTGTVDAGGSYSIGVPATDLNTDNDTQVDGQVTGTGGTTAVAIQNYALDGSNPTPTPPASLKTALSLNAVTGENILSATEQGTTTTTLSGKVTGTFVAGDVVTLKINGTPYTASVAADGSYSVSVQTADLKADSDHKIDASVTGTNGSAATAAQSYVLEDNANVGKVTALTIDPVTADNIIGSAESAGSIAITGKVTGAFAVGDTVTLTVNGKNFSGTVAAGGTYSIPVPAADLLADADTTVDGKVTGTGGTAAVAMQDYGIDPNINPTPAPSVKTALSINPITGDNIINSAESGATSTVITGKVTGTFAAGDVVTLLVNNKTYTGTAAADGSYSISVPTADLVADADTKIEGSVTGGNGGQFASAAQDYVLDANSPSALTKTALSIDPITADNLISDAENTGSINVTGTVTGKFVAGDKVTLTINGKPYTGVADAAGKFTIPVLASDLIADSDTQVDGTVTGTGGTLASALQNYGTNITNPAPAPTPSAKTAIAIDPVTGDNILNSADQGTATITVTGKVTGVFAAGDTVTLSLNGQSFTTTVAADGSFTKAIATSNFTADADTKIEGSVTGTGGSYATAAQDYTLDANAPTNPTQTALSIDPITQDNLIGVSETTGTINVTGHVTGKFAAGDVVTLVINGTTYTATAAADGSYSVAVPAYQLINDPDTQVDGTVTGTGGTTAAALQNYAVDPHVPVNPTPGPVPVPTLKTALTIDAVTTDNIVNATDAAQTTTTITGKVAGTYAAGDVVTLTLNGKDYTASVAANGSYIVSVSTADITNDADTKIEGSVTGTNGSYATAAQDYVVDTGSAPSKTALSINPVTTDNIIGSSENTGSIAITGKVTGAYAIGDQVTLTVNGQTYRGTVLDSAGNYSIPVLASDLVADADSTIDASVHGTGGTTAAAIQNYGVDSNVNPVPPGDTTPPTIVVERTNAVGTTLTTGSTETITFTLSEASTNFDASDITVTGGTLSNFVAVPTSGTAATGYTKYTAVFTPTASASGTATIGVASGKFTDNAGNANQDTYLSPAPTGALTESNNAVSVGYNTTVNPTPDAVKPNIQVSIDKSTLASGQTATLTFILSEASADFTLADVTVISGGGTVSNLVVVPGSNGAQYTATYTAGNTAGVVQIGVAESTFHDAAGNANQDTYKGSALGTSSVANTTAETNNWVSLNVNATDAAAPTVAITRTGTGTVGASGETIIFTFSEGVTSASFTLADIDPVGGAMSNLTPVESSKTATGVYTQYTATFTPTSGATGVAIVGILASKFQDAAGNINHDTYTNPATGTDVYEANNQIAFNYNASNNPADTTPPTIAISASATTLAANATATVTFTLSEASTDFTQANVAVTGGTLSGWTQVNATTYTATYTPTAGSQGTGSVHVDSNAFRDAASNYNQDGSEANNTVNFITNNGVAPTDTTPPTIAITSNQASLATGQTATITFTLSEASSDFTWNGSTGDIVVTGGTLSALTQSSTDSKVYTATFTPYANSTTPATIAVAAGQFHDAANNQNLDTYSAAATHVTNEVAEANNIVTLTVNTSNASFSAANDTNNATEDGAAVNGLVMANDSLASSVTKIALAGGADNAISASTTSANGTTVNGSYGAIKIGADGSYTYTIDNTKASVQALPAGQTVTEVFTYTVTDGATTKTANITITITGANDAPTAVADIATAVEAGGTANGTAGTNPTGNVLTNDTDVDTGDSKTVSAITGGTVGAAKAGTYGSLTLNADGSYSYVLDNANATVQALLPTSTALTDTFTYTVRDATGATSTTTLTVNITGANDAPQVQVALVDTTATTGTAFSYTFTGNANTTADTFKDVDTGHQATLTYSASLADGSSLPSWLSFNATTRTFSGTPPAGTTPGNITVRVTARDSLGLTATDDFVIALSAGVDTTPPTIAITSNQASLTSGQTALITFTLSEASSDFTWNGTTGDVVVTGGTLSALTQDPNNPLVYTATFTPTANSTSTASIGVKANAFQDAASNRNLDTYDNADTYANHVVETNNQVTLTVNTTVSSNLTLINDTVTAVESGVTSGNTAVAGTNPSATTQAAGVLGNDTTSSSLSVTQIAASGGSNSAVTSGSTGGSGGTSITGLYGTLVMGANGTYTYALNNANGTVNALQVGSSLTDVFTYTATDGTTSKTANLTVTINGTDDAPTVSVPLVDQTGTTGTALTYAFDSGTFADVDTADTKTYTATLADGSPLPVWLSFNASTRTFTGTPPAAGTYSVKVTCADSQGVTANDVFDIVVSTAVTPSTKTALTINPVTGDNVILNSENTGNITLTGKVSGTFAEGDTVTLVINGSNYTGTAAADGSYSVSVPATALAADTDKKVEGSVTGTGGQLATAAQTYTVESTDVVTKTALTIDPITADNVVLAAEASGNVAVTGQVTGKFANGDTVTLTVNGHTFTGNVNGLGFYSINVTGSDLLADADTAVDGTVTGTGGSTATALQNYALVDQSGPKIAITRSGATDSTMTAAETITFTLTEASSDFTWNGTTGDIDVTGGSLGTLTHVGLNAQGQDVYTAIFTPTTNHVGTASIGVKAGTFSDASGNFNKDTYEPFIAGTTMEANNIVSVNTNTDVTPPTIAVSQVTSPVTGAVTVTFTLSEASTDFSASDVFVTAGAGSLSNWTAVSGSVYTATFTPTANSSGSVIIGVAAGKFTDAAGLVNKDTYTEATTHVSGEVIEDINNKTTFTFNTDVTPPTVAITGPSGAVNGPVTITFTLSEVSSDFTSSSIAVTGGGTLGTLTHVGVNSNGQDVYTAIYTPPATSTGSATINVASGTFHDTANLANADGGDLNNHLPISYDTVPPTVTVTRATNNTLGGSGATYTTELVTFTLSEASADFVQGSVTVAGGTLSGWTAVSSTVYRATFTPTAGTAGTGTIGVEAGKFHDLAGNANQDTYLPGQGSNTQSAGASGANQVLVDYDTQAPSQTVSFGSMTKDSTLASATSGDGTTSNWTTADTSAGRLVSGFLSAPLAAGETIKVYSNGTLIGNAVVNNAGTAWEITDTTGYSASWTYTAKVMDAAGNAGTTATQAVTTTTVSATTTGTTTGADTVAYTSGTLNAQAGDDTITVASTTIQADLGSTGFIDGGAGIDTLKLAAGTTLNLESLTGNQTVKNIQEVEIFKMQGTSSLQMSANDVLSLGGANATTMTPFSFTATQQVADGATAATGSTSSTGKVQMVVQGTSTDVLKLDTLASDGITSGTGVAGNSGLFGTWDYKGTVQIGMTTYKVYDHSTTNAQVLVDMPVVVNTISPIAITAISQDSSATDFVTNDNTLTYSGTVPVEFVDASHDVFVEILNSSGQVVRSGTATITGTNWAWTDPGAGLADGNYTIRSTIVNQGTTTATGSFGSNGVDTHPMTIDTTLPTIVVTRATSNTLGAGQTETITFTLSEAATDFDVNDVTVTGGSLINFSGSGTTYTATFVPTSGATGTGTVHVDNTKFSDLAGNFNADGADTAAGITNIVSIAYQALPTQTVAFSSMTKDSSLSGANADWFTADGSAGRLVSGTISAPLLAGQNVAVYINNGATFVGYATVNGQAWEVTDLNAYNANWTYTAKVVDSANNAGPVTTQNVNTDFTEAAPVITSVTDSANSSISNNGTTTNTLSTVSGTGNAGDTVYLYDNTGTNLVGTTTVTSNGTWSISGLASNSDVGYGSNTFSARQVDALGNESVLSNLWTVNAEGGNAVANGNFSSGATGFTSTMTNGNNTFTASNSVYNVGTLAQAGALIQTGNVATTTQGPSTAYDYGTWSTKYVRGTTHTTPYLGNPDGTMSGNVLWGQVSTGASQTIWSENVSVVAGKTYTFSFDYENADFQTTELGLTIDGVYIQFVPNGTTFESGHFTATYVATTTKTFGLALTAANTNSGLMGDYVLDNFVFAPRVPAADGTLVAGGTPPATPNADASLAYTGGALDALPGNDVMTASNNVQSLLAAGGLINGGTGVDTLKLAAGTALNLETITGNQTVKPIEQVEIFTLQGGSALTMSANDVLSLGGSNASTMSAYNFTSTTGGTASTSSTGKVQMVVHGTSTDTLVLDPLKTDGVTTNGIVGNTGLAGQWDYMGTTTANGATYKVYNNSTTGAQVLVDSAVNVIAGDPTSVTNVATFSSMTKDSSMATANADWLTNDASAGRLVSGTLASALNSGDVVKVYANGTLVGDATVVGQAWEITDINGYNASWVYTAQVVNSAGKGGTATVQQVNLDNTEAAPVILAVNDTANVGIANNGTTANTLSTVSGTGTAGDTIYLYNNTTNNLVGTTTVGSTGTWSISGLEANAGVGGNASSNTFSARQVDAAGNVSVLSNTWTVSAYGANLLTNGDFTSGNTGFTTTQSTVGVSFAGASNNYGVASTSTLALTTLATNTTTADVTTGAVTWSKTYKLIGATGLYNPDGNMTGSYLAGSVYTGTQTLWSESVNVVAGKTYTLTFDYFSGIQSGTTNTAVMSVVIDGQTIQLTSTTETGHFKATYTAATSKSVTLSVLDTNTGANGGDYVLDNFSFNLNPPNLDGSLVAGTYQPSLNYSAGLLIGTGSNDTMTATTTALQSALAAGGSINGGAGIDTLQLAAGTTLDLTAITHNQTVKTIEQVEIFQMQGGSQLTLSANDVLSLGGANLAGYNFNADSNVTTSSTGKVQMVVRGTTSDALNLNVLAQDGVTTNGIQGNTGLAGEWVYKGTTTIGGVTYKVYDHSTTNAQVLTDMTASTESAVVAFSSMTKDSSLSTANADWYTADGSAGRLVSGTLETPLVAGSVVKIYANDSLLGNATVNAAGTAWEYTDINGYNANWTYRADVVNSSSVVIGSATQVVTTDFTEAPPVITRVTDSTNTSIANAGTTTNTLSSVSGTGNAGDTIYLYDNTSTNLVGTTTVAADGKWTVSPLAGTYTGSNTFSARQVDTLGNESVLSNLWTISASGNEVVNGDFTQGNTGFTSDLPYNPTVAGTNAYGIANADYTSWSRTMNSTRSSSGSSATGQWSTNLSYTEWSSGYSAIPVGSKMMWGSIDGLGLTTLWSENVSVIAGRTYTFTVKYLHNSFLGGNGGMTMQIGSDVVVPTTYFASYTNHTGIVTVSYTALTTGNVALSIQANGGNTGQANDFELTDIGFAAASAGNSLVPGGTVSSFTSGVDGVAGINNGAVTTYTGGTADMLAGDDVLNIGTNAQTLLGTAGNLINGSTGIDTLKLAAGTTLDLTAITHNQTVKTIEQVEVFELQGTSTLTLSANDVLSLGMTNAFTSNGKVQFMVNGTGSDSVSLQNLLSDGAGGNTGLTGMWASAGTASYGGNTYNLYNHDTTGAQVWVKNTLTSVSLSASPLMLDLNGDGVQTTTLANGVQFDLLATGSAQATAWVDRHDGLLAIDLNGDGTINSGAELLGSSTRLADGTLARDGWQALAQYDGNADGQIDLSDAVFNQLRVWVDADADGATDAGELHTLADVGVQSIGLTHSATQTAQNGNILDGMAAVQHTDGSTTQMTDAWLNVQQQPVLNLDAVAHANGVVDLSNGQAQVLQINAGDVLQLPTNASGQHVLQVQGDSNDTVNLSKLFADGHTEGQWTQSGTTTQNGQTFNVYQYSGDASLQVLIDQHIAQSNVHLS